MSNEERQLLEWFRYHLRVKGTGIGRILRKAKEMGSNIARLAHDDWAEIEAKADVCEALLASTEPAPEQEDSNDCRDCGAPHWYNFMVPDHVWQKIAPDQPCLPEEGGMLCAQCIDKRCANLGIEAEGKFYFKGEAVVSRYPEEQGEP